MGDACICVANHDNVACHVYFHLKVPHETRAPKTRVPYTNFSINSLYSARSGCAERSRELRVSRTDARVVPFR